MSKYSYTCTVNVKTSQGLISYILMYRRNKELQLTFAWFTAQHRTDASKESRGGGGRGGGGQPRARVGTFRLEIIFVHSLAFGERGTKTTLLTKKIIRKEQQNMTTKRLFGERIVINFGQLSYHAKED